jgi:hypothetical protein
VCQARRQGADAVPAKTNYNNRADEQAGSQLCTGRYASCMRVGRRSVCEYTTCSVTCIITVVTCITCLPSRIARCSLWCLQQCFKSTRTHTLPGVHIARTAAPICHTRMQCLAATYQDLRSGNVATILAHASSSELPQPTLRGSFFAGSFFAGASSSYRPSPPPKAFPSRHV